SDHLYPQLLIIDTHDVVLRHLRLRPAGQGMGVGPECDVSRTTGVSIRENARGVVVDHCSMTWGNDSSAELQGAQDVTIQWSIIAEGIEGTDPICPAPGGGTLIDQSQGLSDENSTRATLHHNLFAYNEVRNPLILNGLWSVVNNVMYNTKSTAEVADLFAKTRIDVNFVANRLIVGPDYVGNPMFVAFKHFDENPAITTRGFRFYFRDNLGPGTV